MFTLLRAGVRWFVGSKRGRLLGMSLLGLLLVLIAGGWALQLRWEQVVRATISQQTGGELSFRSLRLGWRRVTVRDLRLRDSEGESLARVQEMVLHVKNPWALLDRERLVFDHLNLRGVRASLRRRDGQLAAPEQTLAWLRGDVPLQDWSPEISIRRVVVEDIKLTLTGPKDTKLVAKVRRLSLPQGLQLRVDPLVSITLSPLRLRGVDLRAGGQLVSLRSLEASVTTPDLSASSTLIELGPVALDGLRTEVDPDQGWALPDQLFALSHGLWLARIKLSEVTVSDTVLRSGRARVKVAQISAPRLSLKPGPQLSWSQAVAQDVVLRSGKQVVGRATTVALPKGNFGRKRSLRLSTVNADGVEASITWGGEALGVPKELFALGGLRSGGSLRVGTLSVSDLDLTVRSASGEVALPLDSAELSGLRLEPGGWSVRGVTTSAGAFDYGGPPLRFGAITMGSDRVLRVASAQASTTLRKDLTFRLPPIASEHVPAWLGGSYTGGSEFFGVAFPGYPWRPKKLVLNHLLLRIEDRAIAPTPTTLELPMRLQLGPTLADGRVAVAFSGQLAEGSFEGNGSLSPGGKIVLQIDARKLRLEQLEPWLSGPLSSFGLRLVSGRGAARLRVVLNGSKLTLSGPVRARLLELEGNAAVRASVRAAAGRDRSIELELAIKGDLKDPDFSPLRAVVRAVLKGLGSGLEVEGFGRPKGASGRGK